MTDVFICDYIRTPIGRHGGSLAKLRTDDLAALPLAELMKRNTAMDPTAIEEVWMGCANQAGEDNRNVARMGSLLAGLPDSVPGVTVNRLCGSGMEAIISGVRAIKAGEMELVVAGGVESMSRAPFVLLKSESAFSRSIAMEDTTIGWRFINPRMRTRYGTDSMPETAQNLADDMQIDRDEQDAFALASQQKAGAAMASGRTAREIMPVAISVGKGKEVLFDRDEHPRPETTLADLARLRPITRTDGSVTAGNASGVNDGAAGLILASEAAVKRHGLEPIARIAAGASSGVTPRIMGYGPVPAVQKLLSQAALTTAEIDLFELNEAFAAQVLACLKGLGIAANDSRVNPNGGAIAFGHPLGMSGARITGSAALELSLGTARRAVVSMCVGVGQGVAVLLERV
ncbi:3-oxoadipyl-CoA thiolase (plasmid) [Rhizobium sp. NIBRBAC000502774]|jgi:3-oxoadipyl-CoA thiolase|uniref:3-oxoadipyl-CoA thiolase n=1 Tax=Agrobacterium tumefaciens TaxID=358 RepID=UPI0011406534|nr:3-oxoadipyl-CoA thiolase [Agrobacterium tumefaciens]QDG93912.1 3-oxoadipyl-CoA thiolase [Rhizobium sp. NIBRBAC000502774]